MRSTLCAVAVGKNLKEGSRGIGLVLDPEEHECDGGWAVFAFVFGAIFGEDKEGARFSTLR